MNVGSANDALLAGAVTEPGVLPHLDRLQDAPFVFDVSFGLPELPREPGVLVIRGARQAGKSTWLEGQIRRTVETEGPGSALYLSGDELLDARELTDSVRALLPQYPATAPVRRLFIDEITAVPGWEKALKVVIDRGELRQVLVVTTGSRAADLRRGAERLPGRKGKLERTVYWFTPVPFAEFRRVCGGVLGDDLLWGYVLSGGAPVGCAAVADTGALPAYVVEMARDWILGECAASGRDRSSLLAVMECLHRFAGTPVGQAKLAREAGLANNTVANGYVQVLADLMCVGISHAWDPSRRIKARRKPAKLPYTNLLAALAWHPDRPWSVAELKALPEHRQGALLEWLVAQELWRRAAIRGDEVPEEIPHWQGRGHELDFVEAPDSFVEVKRGHSGPLEFSWFQRAFPSSSLTVLADRAFTAGAVRGVPLEAWLAGDAPGPSPT